MVMAAGLRRALKGLSEAAFRERFGSEEAVPQGSVRDALAPGADLPGLRPQEASAS